MSCCEASCEPQGSPVSPQLNQLNSNSEIEYVISEVLNPVEGADPGNEGSGGAHARPMTSDEAAEPERADGPEEPEVQEAQPKFQKSPIDPTPEEVEAHECGGHIQFAGWCLDCCRGRAQEWGHYLADRANDTVPTIYWDYAYLGSPSEGVSILKKKEGKRKKAAVRYWWGGMVQLKVIGLLYYL